MVADADPGRDCRRYRPSVALAELICEGWQCSGDPELVYTLTPDRLHLLLSARARLHADHVLASASASPAQRARARHLLHTAVGGSPDTDD